MANRFLNNIRINDAYTFPASDGNDGQVITTDGAGNLAFENISPDAASVIYRDNFTGDGSTVTFDLQNSITDEDQTQIYIDGVYQEKSTYSISGTTIAFTTAPISGHSVEVISISSINTGPTVLYQDNFTGNGSDTAFTLGQEIDNEIKTFIFLNGVYQFKNTYTVDGTTLTFDTAPANGVAIEVVSIASAVQSDSLQAGAVIIPVKNTHTASISKGTPVYITGNVGASERLQIAPADASNSAKMPAAGLLLTTLAVNAEGYAITGGYLRNITTDTIDGTSTSSNDTVYVKAGGGLTMTKPTGSNLIQNIAKVARSASGSSGSLLVSSILRTNDVPNLTTGKIWVGDSNTVESTVIHLDESNNRLGINNNSPNYSLDVTGDANISSNVIIGGNLTVDGTQTILNTQTVEVEDNILQLNTTQGSPDTATATTSGISVYRGDGVTQASFIFDDADDTWDLTNNLVVDGNVGINETSPASLRFTNSNSRILDISGNAVNRGGVITLRTSDNSKEAFLANDAGLLQIGMYTNNDVTFYTNNTERMRIDSSGNVGIGIDDPAAKLEVKENLYVSHPNAEELTFRIDNYGTTGTDAGSLLRLINQAGTTVVNIDSRSGSTRHTYFNQGGNVGIGTSSPAEKLDVRAASSSDAKISISKTDDTAGQSSVLMGHINNLGGVASLYNDAGTENIKFRSYGDSYINGGNVGIGETSPDTKLHIKSPTYDDFIKLERDGIGAMGISATSPRGIQTTDGAGSFLGWHVDGSGNVGIGTYTPAHGKLVISSNQNNSNNFTWLLFDNQGSGYGDWNIYKSGNNNLAFGYGTSNGASFSNALTLEYGGNVGIGVSSGIDANLRVDANSATLTQEILKVKGGGSGGAYGFLVEANNGDDLFKVNTLSYDSYFPNGNVGIGVTSPSEKLEVTGNFKLNGTVVQEGTGNNLTYRYRTGNSSSHSGGNATVKFGRLYWTPAHWSDTAPVIKVTIHSKYYQGERREYIIKANYGDANPIINELQPSSTQQKIGLLVGTTTSAGYNYAGQPVYYADLMWCQTAYIWGWCQVESQVPFLTSNPTSGWGGVVVDSSVTQTNNAGAFTNYTSFFPGRILFTGLDGKTQVHPDVSYRTSDGELFYQTSSIRYKKDIVNLESSLNKVDSLRPVRFTDINTNEPSFGLIAEETNEVIPDVVFTKDEQIEGISYSNLTPFLIKAIQELKAEIETLKLQING